MSQKILWSSVRIQVPSEFITVSKTGLIKIKPPLTKKNRISTSNKHPSIQLIPTANTNEVKVIDQGDMKEQLENKPKRQYKPRQKTNNIQEDKIEQPQKKGNRFEKGSQAAKDYMKEMRDKRKNTPKFVSSNQEPEEVENPEYDSICLLYTSPSPRD